MYLTPFTRLLMIKLLITFLTLLLIPSSSAIQPFLAKYHAISGSLLLQVLFSLPYSSKGHFKGRLKYLHFKDCIT